MANPGLTGATRTSATGFEGRTPVPGTGGPVIPGVPQPYVPPAPGALTRPSPASPGGAAFSTNPLVAARFNPSEPVNPITLRGQNNVTGFSGWTPIAIDRPSIVWPTGKQANGSTSNVPFYEVLYAPWRIPRVDSEALRSVRRGICYLSGPGTWWLKYNYAASNPEGTLECLVIDASDPAVASRYLSEPGPNRVVSADVAVSTASVQIVAANPYRKAITIQNTTTTAQVVRIGIGASASSTAGFRLASSGVNSITFAGDSLTLTDINAIRDSSATLDAVLTYIEYT